MKKTFIALILILSSSALAAQGRYERGYSDRDSRDYRGEHPAQGRSSQGRSYDNRFDDRHDRYPRRTDYRDVRLFEVEIGFGGNAGLSVDWPEEGYNRGRFGGNAYVEPRFNIPRSPISVGVQFSFALSGYLYHIDPTGSGGRDYYVDYNNIHYEDLQITQSIIPFVDYNWRNWRHVSMFAGLGVGMAWVKADYNKYYEGYGGGFRENYQGTPTGSGPYYWWSAYHDRSVVVNPRFGVEFWNRLRLTTEYKIMKKDYTYFGMTVGVSIGGGRRGRR